MKLKSLVLFLFFIMTLVTCISQTPDSTSQRKIILKTNLSRFATGEAYVSIEKTYNRHRIEFGAGFIYPFKPWYNCLEKYDIFDYIIWGISEYYRSHGIAIRSQYKYMLGKRGPLYISPLLMFKHAWQNNSYVIYNNGMVGIKQETYKKYVYALEFLVGPERFFSKTLVFDFYYGIGVRYFNEISKYNLNDDDISNDAVYKDCGFRPSIQIGMNIGFRVK